MTRGAKGRSKLWNVVGAHCRGSERHPCDVTVRVRRVDRSVAWVSVPRPSSVARTTEKPGTTRRAQHNDAMGARRGLRRVPTGSQYSTLPSNGTHIRYRISDVGCGVVRGDRSHYLDIDLERQARPALHRPYRWGGYHAFTRADASCDVGFWTGGARAYHSGACFGSPGRELRLLRGRDGGVPRRMPR